MTDLVGRSIAALRSHHDALATLANELSDEQLGCLSGASEWTIAQVLSHLGSQSEIMLAPLTAAVDGTDIPAPDNQSVWDRWDAWTPREQADGFIEHDARYLAVVEGLSAQQRASLRIDLGFMPEPVPLSIAVGMRLNEVSQHAWDVQVAVDPNAEVDEASAAAMVEHFAGGLSFLLGFIAKPDRLDEPAKVAIGEHTLIVDDAVSIRPSAEGATATFAGPAGAVLRLVGGRLSPEHTPAGVDVTGSVSLEDLRAVFPGY